MPTVYSHDRHGRLVYQKLDKKIKKIIRKYPAMYRAGLQGPDFLYFYNPIFKNAYSDMAHHIHEQPAKKFFIRALPIIESMGMNSPEGAYVLGMICHFILDSYCHPYVEAMTQVIGENHNEIETEFERMLLRLDNKFPLAFPTGYLISTKQSVAEVISIFYQGISVREVLKCQKRMRKIKNLLTAPGWKKRYTLNGVMYISGRYHEFAGHFMKRLPNEKCEQTNRGLLKRFNESVKAGADLLEEFTCMVEENGQLSHQFDKNFMGI